ncbi:hypothetical protein [[Pseudomonas] boreopolis]|uniref:hypothetical protein n=1 Tax=Xanthomonas boreopolis TaxID=86183 RepID=UPI003D538CDC
MTNLPETTTEALQAEIDALRAKNAELLAELKAAKAKATDAQAALEAAQGERDAALADVRALRLDQPVAAVLDDVAVDGELFGQLFARHYQFALGDDGRVIILDAKGEPAMVREPDTVVTGGNKGGRPEERRTPGKVRPATFTAGDVRLLAEGTPDAERFVRLYAVRANGGGGPGPGYRDLSPTGPAGKPEAQPAPSPFGLR